jgi:hypothetical protein
MSRLRRAVVIAVVILVAAGFPAQSHARPFRGDIPWSFLLCKFSDSPAPPHDITYYRNLTIATGTNGLADYVHSVSYGTADLAGSTVHGWYTEPHTTAYELAQGRWQRLLDCQSAAASGGYTVPSGQRIYVLTSPGVDLVGFQNTAALGDDNVALPELAHEFGHGIGLSHSFSNDPGYRNATWAQIGEYDNPWDLMSAANVYVDPTGAFGGGPPLLDAHHIDEMGWLPKSRILTLAADGVATRTVTLAALTHPEASGYLLARVPFDGSDPFHFYTVEYRTPDGWDAGIPSGIVLINEVKYDSADSDYHTYLLRTLGSFTGTGNGPPVQSVSSGGVTISVVSTAGNQATVSLHTSLAPAKAGLVYGPNTCAVPYVWREADDRDFVCVSPATRAQARADNAAAGSRHVSGSDTCKQGYVWREAFPGDHVCVAVSVRTQARTDNGQAGSRLMKPNA